MVEDAGEGSQTPVGGRFLENGDTTQQLSVEGCEVMSSVCWVCSAGWDSLQATAMGRGFGNEGSFLLGVWVNSGRSFAQLYDTLCNISKCFLAVAAEK